MHLHACVLPENPGGHGSTRLVPEHVFDNFDESARDMLIFSIERGAGALERDAATE